MLSCDGARELGDSPSWASLENGGSVAPRRSKWLAAASTVSWVWAAVTALTSIAITYPIVVNGRGVPASLIVFFGMALLCGVSAFGLRMQKRPFNVVAVACSVLWIVFLFLVQVKVSLVGIVLNFVVLGVVAFKWRRFE